MGVRIGFFFAVMLVVFANPVSGHLTPSAQAQSFTLSGRVTEPPPNGPVGINAVTLTLTLNGSAQSMTQTNANGDFSFSLPAGSNYDVVPSKPNYTFSPFSQGGTNIQGDRSIFFTGQVSNPPTSLQFATSTATVTEVPNVTTKLDLTVMRVGDASGAASVLYATTDGTASERSDYLTAIGRLRFAAGETSKTITIFIVNDSYSESPENFSVTLSNPMGATLGLPSVVTVTLNSDESQNGPNPVREASFDTDFFVRQHYVDFFNREADPPGLGFWKNQIDECTTQQCRELRKINVSAAFFLSIEFQQTGYLVYKAYQASFNSGEMLQLRDFLPDTQEIGRGVVVGQPGADAQLEANKQTFFNDFVQRQAFLTAYPTTMSAAQFVDQLNGNTLDPRNPGAGPALTATERQNLINHLTDPTSPTLRAQVLRSVTENGLFTQRQFNKAFVLMQYFGYLRRNPNATPDTDFAGYNFWLGKLNEFNGNFVNAEMVKAFITSGEYFQRFGP